MSDANQEQDTKVEGETTVPDAQVEQKPEEVVEPQTQSEELELPDGVTDRAKEQFEKLKAKNKEMAEKLSAFEAPKQVERPSFYEQVPSQAQFPGLSQEQIANQTQSLVDENGYMDVERLNTVLKELNDRAVRAERDAIEAKRGVERYGHTQEVTKAHSEFPELDPDNKSFDPKFYDLVSNHIYGKMMKREKEDLLSAAKYVASSLYDPQAKKAQEAESVSNKQQEAQESKTKRVQASTQVGQGKGQPLPQDHEELVERSRKGDMDAIAKRLQASGY